MVHLKLFDAPSAPVGMAVRKSWIGGFRPGWIRAMSGRVLLLALATLGPLWAQGSGDSCIAPQTNEVNWSVIGVPYSGQFVLNPGWLATHTVFEVQAGTNLPPGLTFTAATGVLAGTPTATGTYEIDLRVDTVPASNVYCGIKFPLIVNKPLTLVSGGALPPGNVNAGYLAWVAQNGAPLYSFAVSSGSLPPGISYSAASNALTGTPLAQGAYSFTATVGDYLGESVTGNYSVVIGPPGNVTVTSAAVNIEALAGGAVQTYPLGVETTDLSAVPFNVSVLGTSGGAAPAWLTVTPTSGTTPARVSLQADPGKLAYGAYLGQIQITPQGQNPFVVPVTFNVLNSRQAFSAAPAGINVSYPANADLTQAVTTPVQVSNTGGATVSVTATATPPVAGSAWVTVTPTQLSLAAGQTQTLSVNVVGANTFVGTHFATITLQSSNQVLNIPVQLSVVGTVTVVQPGISIVPQAVVQCVPCEAANGGDSFTDLADIGGIAVTMPGANTAYTAALNGFGGGVQLLSAGSNASQVESVRIWPCKLGTGSHSGYVEVSAPMLTPSKVYQKIEIIAFPSATAYEASAETSQCSALPPPSIDSSGLAMVAQSGQTSPVTAQITVTGSDDQPLQFAVNVGSDAPPGVTVSPTRGVATGTPTTVTVIVDPTKAPAGVTQSGDMVDVSAVEGYPFAVPKALAGVFLNSVTGPGPAAVKRAAAESYATAACTPTQILVVPTSPPSYFSQRVDWPLNIQARVIDNCGQAVTNASVTASFSNGDAGLGLALTDSVNGIYGATWRPATPAASLTMTMRAIKTGLPMAARPVYGAVVDDPGVPIVGANGVVNNLNPVLGAPVAPGAVVAIYGSNLASSTIPATTVPLPTNLGNAQVLIGGIAAPLFFVSPGQINVQIPTELPANTPQDVIVLTGGNVSIPQTIQLGAVNPGIAVYGTGRAIAEHADYSLITPASPARPEEWIVLYLVGLGATNPAVASNQLSPASPLAAATVQPAVTIDGVAAPFYWAGLTPGGIGLYQINCQVPKGARTGDLPLVVIQGDVAANAATIPVGQQAP